VAYTNSGTPGQNARPATADLKRHRRVLCIRLKLSKALVEWFIILGEMGGEVFKAPPRVITINWRLKDANQP